LLSKIVLLLLLLLLLLVVVVVLVVVLVVAAEPPLEACESEARADNRAPLAANATAAGGPAAAGGDTSDVAFVATAPPACAVESSAVAAVLPALTLPSSAAM
jgi:hypothetical protein